jgi:tripeptidyl-peptidase-1
MASRTIASLTSALLLLVSSVVASPIDKLQKREFAVKSFHHTPRKWQRFGAAPPNHVLELQIGLKQSKIDDLLRHLNEGMPGQLFSESYAFDRRSISWAEFII